MKRTLKLLIVSVSLFFALIVGFGAGTLFGSSAVFASDAEQPREFQVFWQAWDIVQEHFVDRDALDATKLTYGAIRGMVQALGDEGHTAFLTPEDVENHQTSISGTFSGIGAQVGVENGMPVIVAPFDGSPAAEAGIKAGDVILAVDGEDVSGWDLGEVVQRIRGEEGTEVTLTVLREGAETSLDITVTRGEIDVPATSWRMIPGTNTALLRFSQFSADAKEEMVQSLAEIEEAGAEALILDVRNNPGGLLTQAVAVTSQFLEEGNVMQEEDADGNRKVYEVQDGGVATEIPMVVLINPGTASSAEILSGAIQDHERGTLVGETTFGTGTILQPFSLEDGSALLLGTRQWLTADGRLIRKQGIAPDVEVTLPLGAELISPTAIEEMTLDEIMTSDDAQLLKALELLGELPTASQGGKASSQ